MRTLIIMALVSFSAACAGTIQYGSITDAYTQYNKGKYEKTLVLISRAENAKPMNSEQRAEIAYLKARALAGLGKNEESATLLEYIQEQHPTSQYAYFARNKLSAAR